MKLEGEESELLKDCAVAGTHVICGHMLTPGTKEYEALYDDLFPLIRASLATYGVYLRKEIPSLEPSQN